MGLHTLPLLRTAGSLGIDRHGSAIACWRWAVKLLLASIYVWCVKPSIACSANNEAHLSTNAYKGKGTIASCVARTIQDQ
jgi:hypothetical protein